MKDVNFHVETIKRSVDALAQLDQSDKDATAAIIELMQHPNFQMLFNVKLQSEIIHERGLCELIGLKRGALEIADHVFQYRDDWRMSKMGDFYVDTYSSQFRQGIPVPIFVFSVMEPGDSLDLAKGVESCVVGIMKPGEDIVYKVQFAINGDMSAKTMVDILARLAPDFKVFATKL
ncbi:hypothetical protein pEaSNUABM37_00268 [Erwinia phage pEa_SNUABM_37]|nr:hypothetical protein pEaSNUABM37_00268 [Erwinia phage pEa_SNUABM_37]QXO10736.1 hypothetical protein pEaSNUABM48_00268 [Erwinia phage pEa_SNUABM_48]